MNSWPNGIARLKKAQARAFSLQLKYYWRGVAGSISDACSFNAYAKKGGREIDAEATTEATAWWKLFEKIGESI